MSITFYAGMDIKRLLESLPFEEMEHMRRVGTLVDLMSAKLCGRNLSPWDSNLDEIKYYAQAAAYHDLGKVMVPRSLLTKAGKLMADENIIVQKHPLFACQLFEQIQNGSIRGMPRHLFQLAYDSAAYHHEWWNGNGYPYGISSMNIPLIARITSICDTYDAITNNRSYRKARSHDYACRELKVKAGSQFDPLLVQVFLEHESEFTMFIHKRISCL